MVAELYPCHFYINRARTNRPVLHLLLLGVIFPHVLAADWLATEPYPFGYELGQSCGVKELYLFQKEAHSLLLQPLAIYDS